MLQSKKLIIFLTVVLFASVTLAQHPDFQRIDSLRKILPTMHGIQRIDYLNAIGIEYWWPTMTAADTISAWANLAYKEADTINYIPGKATSIMLLGVAEIFRKHFDNGEKYLRQALGIFERLQSDFGMGWCYVWLGQSLYSQNKFDEALDCQKKSIFFFEKLDDREGEGKAWSWAGMTYATLGNYDSSFYYSSKSLMMRQKMSDHNCVVLSFINIGQLYKIAGSYKDALDYYHQAFYYANAHNVNNRSLSATYHDLVGTIYRLKNFPDSSYYFLQSSINDDSANVMTHISLGETLLMKSQYDSALKIFLKPVAGFRKGNDKWDLMRVLMDVAKTYQKKGEDKMALQYALETFSIAKQARATQYILEGYLLLSKLYNQLHINDSAYFFLQQFTALKDSVVHKQFLFQLSDFKNQADSKKQTDKLALMDKENKVKEDKLEQEAFLKWILIACLFVVALSGFIIYKNLTLKGKNEKLESRHRQAEMQQHVTEVEMQALRAQMNPHFIFNCLSSINRFILKNETEAASNYLTKFSRLIRMVLNNSKKPFISLEDELEMLSLYLDMEKLRFKDSFDYSITFTNSIDDGNVFVPPLLLQPFAENAIWHGLMHKEGQGHLEIELSIDKKILTCAITDNGVGRNKAAQIKSKSAEKQKSMGLQITTERLALLNKDHDEQTFFNIKDITDNEGNPAGTRVILKMNYKNLTEVVSEI
ncbi:MAG TPA: histidine kinase [Chitinophagaceae bacterium]|jgi:tetratricopeptide (TPR) repeat protein|nr:histidine kinase [Chitinophagaceae bacterium]